jgi:hypothetical protein
MREAIAGAKNPAYKHGHATRNGTTPEYKSWAAMMTRCYNPKSTHYEYYGGRGIQVTSGWQMFEGFLKDMGHRPKGQSLDRVDPNSNYCPANCRWATRDTQGKNRRKSEVTERYRRSILQVVSILPTTIPELYTALDLHPEVVKQEVRKLRTAGALRTTPIPSAVRGKTLLCEAI